MPNIRFEYLYRDAGNYKIHGAVIFSNPENIEITTIQNALNNLEFFDPKELRVPHLKPIHFDFELDHFLNEYSNIEETSEPPTDSRSINFFLKEISYLKAY